MKKSKRKIEDWSTQIYGSNEHRNTKYGGLKGRELAIMASSALDIGLAHAIEKKIRDDEGEVQSFLGLDGDGRAPLGSFGSRIQMAYLIGIISKEEMKVFRSFKKIRNLFAHKVNALFSSTDVRKDILRLVDSYFSVPIGKKKGRLEDAKQVKKDLDEESCELIFKRMFEMEIIIINSRISQSERMEIQRDRRSKYEFFLNQRKKVNLVIGEDI